MLNRFGDIDVKNERLAPIYGYHAAKLVSFEDALESIVPLIEELPRFIKIAKKYCHFPSEDDLSHDESAAVYIYTMEWGDSSLYRVLNKALRDENRKSLKIWFPYLKLFDTALEKLPTVREVVWRGVPLDISQNYAKNQVITWWSINSCSLSVDVIDAFLENGKHSTLFLIEAVNGKQISGYTEREHENEIILRMGTDFRVKANTLKHNGSSVIHLVELDDNDDRLSTASTNSVSSTSTTPRPCTPSVVKKSSSGSIKSNASVQNTKKATNTLSASSSSQHSNNMKSQSSSSRVFPNTPLNAQWSQKGNTIISGVDCPQSFFVDDDDTIIYADYENHRIIEWKISEGNGKVVAGGNGEGNRLDQLRFPIDVLVDKATDTLVICDWGNQRVVRWPRHGDATEGEIMVENIIALGFSMDDQGYIYISNKDRHEVRQYYVGDQMGTVVAGGNGKGPNPNQLNTPYYVFVDQQCVVYVSDYWNHRVVKWPPGAKQGIVVAGGNGKGNATNQLCHPMGIFVDGNGSLYVADSLNHRVVRWLRGAKDGTVIAGGNGQGNKVNQFDRLDGLSLDCNGNLFVTDKNNRRIQRFSIE